MNFDHLSHLRIEPPTRVNTITPRSVLPTSQLVEGHRLQPVSSPSRCRQPPPLPATASASHRSSITATETKPTPLQSPPHWMRPVDRQSFTKRTTTETRQRLANSLFNPLQFPTILSFPAIVPTTPSFSLLLFNPFRVPLSLLSPPPLLKNEAFRQLHPSFLSGVVDHALLFCG